MKGSLVPATAVAGLLMAVAAPAALADGGLAEYRVKAAPAKVAELGQLGYDLTEGGAGDRPDVASIVATPEQAEDLSERGYDVQLQGAVRTQAATTGAAQDPFEGKTALPFDVFRPYNLQPTGPVTPGGPAQVNLRTELQQLKAAHPDRVKLVTIGNSRTGIPIIAAKVTTNAQTVPDNSRPAALYTATQHAREWIATEVNRRTLRYMVETNTPEIQSLRDTREMWFVLVYNPDGYDWTFTQGNRLWRKNLRDNDGDGTIEPNEGVDPNRNLATKWNFDDEGSNTFMPSETYRGPGPGSEPESQAIDNLYNRVDFKTQSNWHSHGKLLLYPESFQVETEVADDPIFTALAGDDARPAIPGFDPDLAAELYTTNGDLVGHAYDAYGVLAYTPELTAGDPSRPGGGTVGPLAPRSFIFQDIEADVWAEFENTLAFSIDLAKTAGDPDDPVSHLGNTVPDFEVSELDVSHGSPQAVQANVKRALGPVSMFYEINDSGQVHRVPAQEWDGGTRYGATGDRYYHRVRGTVQGARAGDRVTVSFGAGSRRSDSFTYRVRSDSGAPVLVLSAENYDGPSPDQAQGPHHLGSYVDALRANGVDFDVYDVDANDQRAPDPLGVLSHYQAVIWYSGDDLLPRMPGQPAGTGVAKFADDTILAVRDYLNEGGRLLYTGQNAGVFIEDTQFGYNPLEAQNGFCTNGGFTPPPGQVFNCNIVSNDFKQYWLGAFAQLDTATTKEQAGALDLGLPSGDLEFRLNGAGSADNHQHASSLQVTSDVLPPDEYPQFRSERAAGQFAPAPTTGARYAFASSQPQAWKRLTKTVDLTGRTSGELRFKTAYDIESDFDYLFVEARTLDDNPDDDWTTLPDANGHTSQTLPPGGSCDQGWRDDHPQLDRYQTDPSPANGNCQPTGTTGAWHAATGDSHGYQDWRIDLSRYAGKRVELSITHATDIAVENVGVLLDDVAVSLTGDGGTVTDQTSFEDGTGGWNPNNPASENPASVDLWTARRALGQIKSVGVATPRTVFWGFGLEGIRGADTRTRLLGDALGRLGVTDGGPGGGGGGPGSGGGDGGNVGNNGGEAPGGDTSSDRPVESEERSDAPAPAGAVTGARGDAADGALIVSTRRARVSRTGVARIRVTCGAAAGCRGTVRLTHRGRTLARASVSLRAGTATTVRLRLNGRGVRLVRARRTVSVRAVVAGAARGSAVLLRAARSR